MAKSEHKLLIVDDDEALQQQLRWAFAGFDVSLAGSREAAMAVFEQAPAPVVLLDLGLPPDQDGPSEGLAALESILALAPETKIVVMTGQTERQYAVRAIGLGASFGGRSLSIGSRPKIGACRSSTAPRRFPASSRSVPRWSRSAETFASLPRPAFQFS